MCRPLELVEARAVHVRRCVLSTTPVLTLFYPHFPRATFVFSRFGRSHSCPWQRGDPAKFRAAMDEKRKLDAAKREARESEAGGREEL